MRNLENFTYCGLESSCFYNSWRWLKFFWEIALKFFFTLVYLNYHLKLLQDRETFGLKWIHMCFRVYVACGLKCVGVVYIHIRYLSQVISREYCKKKWGGIWTVTLSPSCSKVKEAFMFNMIVEFAVLLHLHFHRFCFLYKSLTETDTSSCSQNSNFSRRIAGRSGPGAKQEL